MMIMMITVTPCVYSGGPCIQHNPADHHPGHCGGRSGAGAGDHPYLLQVRMQLLLLYQQTYPKSECDYL